MLTYLVTKICTMLKIHRVLIKIKDHWYATT
jgi:hypothetical protein